MIQHHTFDFLKELVENNNREWFQANKERYDAARENVIEFTAELIKLMHKIDPGIDSGLDSKKCVMRIYRDIRFSKNKTPYKNSMSSISLLGASSLVVQNTTCTLRPTAHLLPVATGCRKLAI